MDYKEEVEAVYQLLIHPAGYDIGCAGIICVRRYEHPEWAVEWEEYHNPHDNHCKRETEVLEFENPMRAAECFVELRHKCGIGLDYDEEACKNPPDKLQSPGYYLLGSELEAFKEKYSK